VELLKKVGGLALGVMDDYSFADGTIALGPGDALVLYTDGVNEAMNAGRELFRAARIDDALRHADDDLPAEHLAGELMRRVHEFVGGAPQNDDMTILVARYRGRPAEQTVPLVREDTGPGAEASGRRRVS
jgi:phosphoserine phosphatase RsbU/P